MRLARLRDKLPDLGVDAFLISQPENRRYLSGFTGSAGWLLVSERRAVLATDFRYMEQASHEAPDWELARVTTALADLLPGLLGGTKRLGFESQHVTVDQLATWSQAVPSVEWVPLKNTVETLRAIKDEAELEAIRRSAALSDAALAHAFSIVRPDLTEQDVAWEIEAYMRTHGASRVAFDLIVAAGPRSALPHARATERAIRPGEPIVFDIGCVVDGYCSDLTRTVCLGKPDEKYVRVWELVREAQQTALEAIRAGMTGAEADATARDRLVAAGYGEYFGHGLGHGVGLAVHEDPRASRLYPEPFQTGMTLTVEPGIYLPGEFGVRIEDLVVIREDGVEILSCAPKSPGVPIVS